MAKNVNIQELLHSWAEDVVKNYVGIARSDPKYDIAFYQQSPLRDIKERVDIVVMGINPGSSGSYTSQKSNKEWSKDGKDFIGKHLLNGNPRWVKHKKEWSFWRNTIALMSPAFGNILENDTKTVFTNATFFNTPKASALTRELMNKTLSDSIKLIDILSPTSKIVITLSGATCFDYLKTFYKVDFQTESIYGNKLILGRLNGFTYIGIYHPASRYTRVLTKLIQKAIKLVKEHVNLELEKLKELIMNQCANEWEDVKNYVPTTNDKLQCALELKRLLETHFGIEKPIKGKIRIRLNDRIEAVFVAQSKSQCIYWRHIDYNGKIHYDNPAAAYSHAAEIMGLLKRKGYKDNEVQTNLGQKPLTSFNYMGDIDCVAAEIEAEIIFIEKEICKLFDGNP